MHDLNTNSGASPQFDPDRHTRLRRNLEIPQNGGKSGKTADRHAEHDELLCGALLIRGPRSSRKRTVLACSLYKAQDRAVLIILMLLSEANAAGRPR